MHDYEQASAHTKEAQMTNKHERNGLTSLVIKKHEKQSLSFTGGPVMATTVYAGVGGTRVLMPRTGKCRLT